MRKVLIAAINSYPIPYQLQGSLNDAVDLQNTLSIRGFTSFVTLLDGAATRSGIMAQLQSLVSNAVSGDSIMFAFFGHGTPGGICPADINVNTGANAIYDHEMGAILASKKTGVTCDVLLGCCYSGTGTRAMAESLPALTEKTHFFKEKLPKLKKLVKTPALVLPSPRIFVPVPDMNHCLFAASSETGLAWGVRMGDGTIHGLHTVWWCYVARNALTWSRAQIDAYVSAKVKLMVSVQDPQLEGPSAELAQLPFE